MKFCNTDDEGSQLVVAVVGDKVFREYDHYKVYCPDCGGLWDCHARRPVNISVPCKVKPTGENE